MQIDYKYTYPVNADGQALIQVPIELLCVEDFRAFGKQIENFTPEWDVENSKFRGKSVMRLTPHLDLFDYFHDGGQCPDRYVQWYDAIHRTRNMALPMQPDELLTYRFGSYRVFSQELSRYGVGAEFFELPAKFDRARNVFLLSDGHHRCAFLMACGIKKIPLRVAFAELTDWLNLPSAFDVDQTITAQSRELIYCSITNPMIRALQVERDCFGKSRLEHILRFFGSQDFPSRMLDIGSNAGFFSFHLAREQRQVTGCDFDKNHHDLAVALSKLYRLSPNFINLPAEEVLEQETEFDAVFMLTVFYHLLRAGHHEPLLRLLDRKVKDFIIWESGDEPEAEIHVITSQTKFTNYRRLALTFGTGRARELGIFYRDGWEGPRTS